MGRPAPHSLLVHLVLNALTRTGAGGVRYGDAVVGSAVALLLAAGMHRTVMRGAVVLGQRHLVRLVSLHPALLCRFPNLSLRGEGAARRVLRRHHRAADGLYRRFNRSLPLSDGLHT